METIDAVFKFAILIGCAIFLIIIYTTAKTFYLKVENGVREYFAILRSCPQSEALRFSNYMALKAKYEMAISENKTYQDLTEKLKEENSKLKKSEFDNFKYFVKGFAEELHNLGKEKLKDKEHSTIHKTGYYEFNLDLQNNKFLFGIEQKPVNGIARFKDGEIYFSDFEQ